MLLSIKFISIKFKINFNGELIKINTKITILNFSIEFKFKFTNILSVVPSQEIQQIIYVHFVGLIGLPKFLKIYILLLL